MPTLLAVPNFSTAEAGPIEALEEALSAGATVLDRHTDADHGRTVLTVAAAPGPLGEALLAAAEEALAEIDMSEYRGAHPAVGALDVCPIVWLRPEQRRTARVVALELGARIGEAGVPVFLYGELAATAARAERAYFRNGGLAELWLRMEGGETAPDFGPPLPHRSAGATLVTARPPLAAFNVELEGADLEAARAVAAGLREAGGGLPGVRAIGLLLSSGRAQVSTNVHDPLAVPLARVVSAVRELAAPLGARPVEAELVGLVPAGAVAGYPADVPIRGFDPDRHLIERRLAAVSD